MSAWALAMAIVGTQAGCTDTDNLFEECVRDEECQDDEICLNQLCQSPQCDTEEIACGRDCVNPRIELEFCGGCNGCPGTDNAEGIQCLEGQCIYRCLDGFVDVNDDINDPNGDGCECVPDGPEVCDGIDNDCDGLVDAMDDDVEPCDAETGAEAACVAGACEQACTPGLVDVNEDLGTGGNGCECEPTGEEVCDGQDNDCDGLVDTEDDDLEVDEEVCDGQDNDCDGDIDEDDDDFTAPQCQLTDGVCAGALASCQSGAPQECSADFYAQHAQDNGLDFELEETFCDDIDNDCDGRTDELCCLENQLNRRLFETNEILGFSSFLNNADKTQFIHLYHTGVEGDLRATLMDATGQTEHEVTGLGFKELQDKVTAHWDPSTREYVVVRNRNNSISITRVSQQGVVSFPVVADIGRELRDIKTMHISQNVFWLVGIDTARNLLVQAFRDDEAGTSDTIRTNELGFFYSIESLHLDFPAFTFLIATEFSEENNAGGLNRELVVTRVSTSGLSPQVDFGNIRRFDKTSINETGQRSRGAIIDDNDLYRVVQEGDVVRVVRQRISDGPGGPRTTFFESDDEIDLKGVFPLEDGLLMAIQVETGTNEAFVFEEELGGVRSVNIFDFQDFSFGDFQLLPHLHGAAIFVRAESQPTGATTAMTTFNTRGQLLCPWRL